MAINVTPFFYLQGDGMGKTLLVFYDVFSRKSDSSDG